jgi:hypothetical protein
VVRATLVSIQEDQNVFICCIDSLLLRVLIAR